MVIYLLARERKQPGTFAFATGRSACAILFAIRDDKGALHGNFSHFLSVVQIKTNICSGGTDGVFLLVVEYSVTGSLKNNVTLLHP